MLPSLREGRYFLIRKYPYRFARPQRGDIVVLRAPQHPRWLYVKRVIGLEGDLVEIASGRVTLNGRLLEEPYALGPTLPDLGPIRIEKGAYFVMGDNRANSEDSRLFGSIPVESIEGKI